MKAKLLRLERLAKDNARKLGAVVIASAVLPAMAEAPAQPDVSDAAAYLLASIATIAIIGNARLIVAGALTVFRTVRSALR